MSFSEWREVKLEEIIEIEMGQSPKSEFYNSEMLGLPFLQGNRTFGDKYPFFDTYCTQNKKIAQKNDVIMSVRAPVGDLNIAPTELSLGRGVCAMRLKKSDDNEYLFYLMKHNIREMINQESGTVFGSVNKKDILGLKVMTTESESEQKAIAHILSTLDEKIEVNNRINKTLEEIAQAIFKHWFVDFEFPNEDGEPYKSSGGEMVHSELGLIPKGWEVRNISDVCNVTDYVANGSFASLKNNVTYVEKKDGYAVLIRLVDYNRNFDDDYVWVDKQGYDFLKKTKLFGGEVIISNVGANSGTVFRVPRLGEKMTLGPNSIMLVPNEFSHYLFCFFTSRYGQDKLMSIRSGSAQPKFNKTTFRSIKVVTPSKGILFRFSEIYDALQEQKMTSDMEVKLLIKIRDTLLPKLMSGEIRVPLDNEE